MARLVKKEAHEPIEITPSDKPKWACMCGLSKNQPYCDSSHKKTRDEVLGKIYKYNEDGSREEVKDAE